MKTFTLQSMIDHVATHDAFDDELTIDDLRRFASSMTSTLTRYYERNKLLRFDNVANTLTIDVDRLHVIDAICVLIDDEYDIDDAQMTIFDAFHLRDDDDVDRNSSYVSMIVDIVKSMIATT